MFGCIVTNLGVMLNFLVMSLMATFHNCSFYHTLTVKQEQI